MTILFLEWLRRGRRGRCISPPSRRVSLFLEQLEARDVPSAGGLVAAYSFNEGTGATLYDSSGNGNNGVISNATWSTAGTFGDALSFNGSNSLVTIPDSPSLNLTSGMTIEAWVNPAALSGWRDVLLKARPAGLSYALYATDPDLTNSPSHAEVTTGGADWGAKGGGGLPLNAWSFLAATYDGSTLRYYLNGNLVGSRRKSSPSGIVETQGALTIGGNTVWGEYFEGLIDNVRVYNTALTGAQVQADMTTPVPPPSSSAPLTATITGLPASGYSPNGTQLTLGATVSGGVGADAYSWTVTQNGATVTTGSGSSFSFTPGTAGTYQVALAVTDSAGDAGSASGSVVADQPPTVSLGGPYSGQAGSAITFAAGASNPNPGEAAGFTYSWNFGDGQTDSGTSATDSHAYAAAGTYTATVTATDSVGEKVSATATVNVAVDLTATITGLPVSGYSPKGPQLTLVSSASGGVGADTYAWTVTQGGAMVTTGTGSSFSFTPSSTGMYQVALSVTDTVADKASASGSVVVDQLPTVSLGGPYSGQAGAAIGFTASAVNPNVGEKAGFTYRWNFGDGKTDSGTSASDSHAYAAAGTYTATVTATDSVGETTSSTATVSVSASLSAPPSQLQVQITGLPSTGESPEETQLTLGAQVSSSLNYAQVTAADNSPFVWAASTSDPRALLNPNAAGDRVAGTWFSSSFTVDVNLTDGRTHRMALYLVDWDNLGRSERIDILNANTGAVLDSQVASNFVNGEYLTWAISGDVQVRITDLSGANAVLSGIFFDSQISGSAPTSFLGTDGTTQGNWQGVYGADGYQVIGANTNVVSNTQSTWTVSHLGQTVASGAGAAFAFTLADTGSYQVTVVTTDSAGSTASATGSVTVDALDIQTSHDLIPNFGANPTISALRSGTWSDPTIWSTDQLPGAGDVVSIGAGDTVTYNVVSTANVDTVAIQAGGTLQFSTSVNTELTVINLLVMPGGTLTVGTTANPVAAGVTAQIIFPDVSFNYTEDPSQYGHGLIGLGNVFMCGAAMNETWVQLASDAHAGDTTLTLAQPVSGWQVGAKIVLPDTQEILGIGAGYSPEYETATIAAVSPNGLIVTLASPLQFNHLGSTNLDGKEEFMPDVGILSHNVVVRSQNPSGVRGHVVFMDRADVDIRYVQFTGLGRTKGVDANSNEIAIDNTTYDANGNVTHIGTNEAGRYAVFFDNVAGPTAIPADGYQFTFIGNSIYCPLTPMPYLWGLDLNDSHYGLVEDNVLYNWSGAGIAAESGNETGNLIESNFVVRVTGDGARSNDGRDGVGFWFEGTNNYVINNVAADIYGGAFSYGFSFSPEGFGPEAHGLGTVAEPAYQGAETWVAGQYNLVNTNAQPLLEFSGNEVYGSENGLTVWYLGMDGSFNPIGTGGTVKDLTVWNVTYNGIFLYYTNDLTIDGFVARGGSPTVTPSDWAQYGIFTSDYEQAGLVITNSNIQGFTVGIQSPPNGIGETLIENSYLRNITDVLIGVGWSVGGGQVIQARTTVMQDVVFDAPPGMPLQAVVLDYEAADGDNIVAPDLVYVYDYDGAQGDNFQLFFTQQAPDFVVPANGNDGNTHPLVGAPVAGLTNAQLWAKYGMAIAGAVAPDELTMDGIINGYVAKL